MHGNSRRRSSGSSSRTCLEPGRRDEAAYELVFWFRPTWTPYSVVRGEGHKHHTSDLRRTLRGHRRHRARPPRGRVRDGLDVRDRTLGASGSRGAFPRRRAPRRHPHAPRAPRVELVAGGFPCQDLSQAGRTAGIRGTNSGLVGEVFRLLERERPSQPGHRERRDPLLHGDSRTTLELRQPAGLRFEHLVDHPPDLAQRAGVNG